MALILSGDTGPSFVQDAAMPTGSVIQVITGSSTNQQTSTATSFTATNTAATITPSSASNKILILVQANFSAEQNNVGNLTIYRNSTNLGGSSDGLLPVYLTASKPMWAGGLFMHTVDLPNSTSAVTYTVYARGGSGNTWTWNWGATGCASTITLMEIAG